MVKPDFEPEFEYTPDTQDFLDGMTYQAVRVDYKPSLNEWTTWNWDMLYEMWDSIHEISDRYSDKPLSQYSDFGEFCRLMYRLYWP